MLTDRKRIYSTLVATCMALSLSGFACAEDSAIDYHNLAPEDYQSGPEEPLSLGDSDHDFVFTPVTPCRIVNTKAAGGGGILVGGTSREFLVYGGAGDLNAQGGDAGGCSSPVGEPVAVYGNITVVPAGSQGGNVRVYPAGEATPTTSLVNFKPGVNIANTGAVKTTVGSAADEDIEVYASKDAWIIIDVMGYFSRPETTKPEYVKMGGATTTLTTPGINVVLSEPCPEDYQWVSAGTSGIDQDVRVVGFGQNNYTGQSFCLMENNTGGFPNFQCYANCIRIPGR